jgi:hypothetical protein
MHHASAKGKNVVPSLEQLNLIIDAITNVVSVRKSDCLCHTPTYNSWAFAVPERSPESCTPPMSPAVAGARSIVGLPATPLPFVTVMLAEPAAMLRPTNVSAPVWVRMPFVL